MAIPASRLLRRSLLPLAAGAGAATFYLSPRTIYAEEPQDLSRKKPIYDPLPNTNSPPPNSPSLEPTRPTPTDRLATHIRTARQFINTHYSVLSHRFNEYLNQYLHYEHTVTSTVASLAPPKGSGEQVVPGSIYVLVTAMAGSILTRRRIWPIRILTPIVVATGASWYFLPLTTRNVGELLWHFEKKVPAVAETHLQIRKTAEDNIAVIRQNIVETRKVVDENVTKGRETIEEWVKKQ